ncbi:MAG: hypothetical protein HZB68_01010 [Candidatus Aenigmarchaeota archaeon]|nr:hypothetical protein [Candidatus Aenigmarchaeota archaeon]
METSDRDFWLLFAIQTFFSFAVGFGWNMAYLFWMGSYSYFHMVFYFFLSYTVAIAMIPLSCGRKVKSRHYVAIGIVMRMVTFFLASKALGTPISLFVVAIPFGIMMDFYWIPFNARYLKMTNGNNRAFMLTVVQSPWTVTGVIGPVLGGIAASQFGYPSVFYISMLSLFLALMPLHKLSETEHFFDFRASLSAGMEFAPLFIIEGVWNSVTGIITLLFTAVFVREEIGFGAALSYLGLVSIVSSLVLGKLSDRFHNRGYFIAVLVILNSLFTIASAFSQTLVQWIATRSAADLFAIGIMPFTFTMIREKIKLKGGVEGATVVSREFFLNIGRALGAVLCMFFVFYFNNLRLPLFLTGILYLFYPLLLRRKGLLKS